MEETPQITYEVSAYDLASATFVREVMTRALPYVQSFRWPTDENSLGPLAGLSSFVIQKSASSEDGVFEFQGCVIFIHLGDGFVNGYVGGGKEVISSVIETLRVRLPEVERARDFEIPVTFWYAARHGVAASRRRIAVDPWRLVEDNYPRPTRQMLDSLMTGFRPGPSGRLILWHGEPGTGKSYALRTLAWEWREWCRFEYVVDSERFLGDGDYLMRVLLESPRDLLDEEDEPDHDWRLVVLEDAGELMVADARDRVGQGLSRLLEHRRWAARRGTPTPHSHHNQRAARTAAPCGGSPRTLRGRNRIPPLRCCRRKPVAGRTRGRSYRRRRFAGRALLAPRRWRDPFAAGGGKRWTLSVA